MAAAANPLLASLDIKASDRVVSIKENGNIDSNFVITHLIKQILADENNKLCFLILHNTLGHYHNVGKRLGYDFLKKRAEGVIETIEPWKDIVDDIGEETKYFIDDKELVVKTLFRNVKAKIASLFAAITATQKVYLVIDDISHLLDLGIDLKYIISFINYCVGLVSDDRISVVINTHVCTKADEIICNNLHYVSDVVVEVLPLSTGVSLQVTGVLNIERLGNRNVRQLHFKAYDKGIKTFHMGESVYNLYK